MIRMSHSQPVKKKLNIQYHYQTTSSVTLYDYILVGALSQKNQESKWYTVMKAN